MTTFFGIYLRQVRFHRGHSLRVLGKMAGLDHSYVHRLEVEGKRPSKRSLAKLCDALETTTEETCILYALACIPMKKTDVRR